MNTGEGIDQFQLLEDKIDSLIELITTLRKEKESFAEKIQIQERNQERKLADLAEKFENLKTAKDKAKQRITSLLEKVEQIDILRIPSFPDSLRRLPSILLVSCSGFVKTVYAWNELDYCLKYGVTKPGLWIH